MKIMKLLLLAVLSGSFVSLAVAGEYSNALESQNPKSGRVIDESGNYKNEVDHYWNRTFERVDGLGPVAKYGLSNSSWTLIPSSAATTARQGIWFDAPSTNPGSIILTLTTTTNVNSWPPVNEGMLMSPSDSPWALPLSSSTYLLARSSASVFQDMWAAEVK